MPGPVFLEGETVELRTVEPEDADDLQRMVNDPRVREGLTRVDPVSGPEEEEWIESSHEDDGVHLAVCADGDLCGTVGLHHLDDAKGTAEIGYTLLPEAWGNGYATDAARTICRYAFDERGLAKLNARVLETNPASQRVLEKVGFVEEGVFREQLLQDGERVDVHRYGLLPREFEPR